MSDEKLNELYINWKGLEFIHSLKHFSRIILIVLSIVFIIISTLNINQPIEVNGDNVITCWDYVYFFSFSIQIS